jgi:hypothetical protein
MMMVLLLQLMLGQVMAGRGEARVLYVAQQCCVLQAQPVICSSGNTGCCADCYSFLSAADDPPLSFSVMPS